MELKFISHKAMKDLRILYLTWCPPYPTDSGGSQRSALLFEALSELADVDMVLLASLKNIDTSTEEVLRERYSMIANVPLTIATKGSFLGRLNFMGFKFISRIIHHLDGSRSKYHPDPVALSQLRKIVDFTEYDLVVGRYLQSLARLSFPEGRCGCILDIDDLDSDIYKSKICASNGIKAFIGRYHLRNILKSEKALFRNASHCWVSNPENIGIEGPKEISLLANVPYSETETKALAITEESFLNVMIIAGYAHRPNREGVDWFIRSVWPLVTTQFPAARLKVYGSGLTDTLREEWSSYEGVEIIGFIDNVRDAYASSLISVCPVASGAGTNIKVLESYSFGRVCVLSETAARGFRQYPDLATLLDVTKSESEMADQVIKYLKDPSSAVEKGRQLYEVTSNNISRQSFCRDVKNTVSRVVEQAGQLK